MDFARAQLVSFSPLNGVASHRSFRSMGRSFQSRTKGRDARARNRVAPTSPPTRAMPLPQGRGPDGPLISRVRDEANDLTVHVRSPLPSHLRHPDPRVPYRVALSRCPVGRSGGGEILYQELSIPCSGCFLHRTISASTPLGGASPLAPLVPLRAPPLSVALVSSMGASSPTRGGLSAPTAGSVLRQPPFRGTAQTVARVFVKALARLPTAYGSGDRRLLPPASCFDHQHALAARVSVAERATDPHRRCR